MDQNWQRTVTCGELRASHNGISVILNGWIARLRNHGGLIFIILRDRYGLTQITIKEEEDPELFAQASVFKMEYCLAIKGKVSCRAQKEVNLEMATGEIEVFPIQIKVLNTSHSLPFMITQEASANDTTRLQYRYLGLRNSELQSRLILRSTLAGIIHHQLKKQNFIEIETPTFVKSTPEGARDFLVPARIHKGSAFALAQSPQLFKQMLMMGGLDRYYQIARCYRDEDPRGDRQPEFTQIDIEMSFIKQKDIMRVIEEMLKILFKETLGIELPLPFPHMTHCEAMSLYGSDKPDTRFRLLLQDVTDLAKETGFTPFCKSPIVTALVYKGDISRKQLTELEETAKTYNLTSLGYFKVRSEAIIETGLAKYITNPASWLNLLGANKGDTVLLAFGKEKKVIQKALGQVRLHIGRMFNLIDTKLFNFLWIDSFPLFEKHTETGNWIAKHHMFTRPQSCFLDSMEDDPESVLGELYDLVCNGWELGSGSIRIHELDLQQRIFKIVGYSQERAEERFGYFLEAMNYGAPPHGGIALGFDRLVAIMTGQSSIREVLAFPRNTSMINPLDKSPAPVDESITQEAGFTWTPGIV